MDDAATQWLSQQVKPKHALRGAGPDEPQSDDTTRRSQLDSSGTIRHSVRMDSSQSRESSRGSHIASSNDSRSDISNDWRSMGASTVSNEAPSGTWPSVGSELHPTGSCRPCLFSHTAIGCSNGSACDYCHLNHRRQRGTRPCKAKRDRFKAIAEREARQAGLLPESAAGEGDGGDPGASGPSPDGGNEDWAELVDDPDVPVRRNAQGRRILHL